MATTNYQSIDQYIRTFPWATQVILEEIRQTIREVVPEAKEVISYQMPTFKLRTNLVHFAGFENHIGFYPTPSGIEAFKHRFNNYKWAKGSVQFPLDQPIPYDLIRDITKFRLSEVG